MFLLVGAAGDVFAQPKDPFRPPGTSGAQTGDGTSGAQPPGVIQPQDPADPRDGLARTGQDVGTPFAAGLGLIAAGLALRLTAQAVRPGIRRTGRHLGRRPRIA